MFSFHRSSTRYSFFVAKSLLSSCVHPAHFQPFFRAGDFQFCESRRLGLVRPQDPSWCPVSLSSGSRPLLAVSGSSLGSPDVVCHCGGTWDGGVFAPRVLLSRVLTEAGRRQLLRQQPVRRNPWASLARYLQNSLCPGDVGSRHPCP